MRAHRILAVFLVLGWVAGCDKDDVVIRTEPKDLPRPAVMPAASADAAPHSDHQSQGEVHWSVPTGWKQLPGDGKMRYASFQVLPDHPELQLTVIPLSPSPVLENVNRWEGQIGLPPTPASEIGKVVKPIQTGGLTIDTVDLLGPEDANPRQRLLGGMVEHGGQMWFFKLQGPAAPVGTQKANFEQFIASIHFDHGGEHASGDHAPGSTNATTEVPPGHPPIPPQGSAPAPAGAASGSSAPGVSWTIPAGWEQQPDRPMRTAGFLAGANGAEMIISQFGRDAFGGALDNINRWRAEAGVEPVQDEKQVQAQRIAVNGKDSAIFDFAGPEKRVRVAMVYDGTIVWFFKLRGPKDAVDGQTAAFDQFLQSVQFGGGK